jgi:hypothetical protein
VQEPLALTKHQQAVAKAVATTLEPLLKEIDRKLDAISEQLDTLLAYLATTAARIEEAARRNGTTPHA